MIYYFSGTGNSKWVAEQLAGLTDDQTQSIPELTKDGPTVVFVGADARVGIVFPVYAWGAPLLVEQFCSSIKIADGAYAFAVCTCGDEAGNTMERLKRYFDWKAAWSLAMPSNYIPMYDVDSPALERQKTAAAREKLSRIAEIIRADGRAYDVRKGVAAGIKTALVRPMFNTFARRTSPFHVTDACDGCGLCARICPIQAIKIEQGAPRWVRKNCTQCLGCINRCPQRAIQYGKGTASRGRYFFHEG